MNERIEKMKNNEVAQNKEENSIFKEYRNNTTNNGENKISNILKVYSKLNNIIEIFENIESNDEYENKEPEFLKLLELDKNLFVEGKKKII